ncbi:MAG: COX15/CtaA family protein [Burkholderiales bacterium]
MNPRADDTARVRAWFVRLALAAAALTFVVVVASAFMRHWQAGLACPDWPACHGRVDPAALAVPPLAVRAARMAHRLAATGVLVALAGLLLVAWTQSPRWTREGTPAAIALTVTLGLAALGVATPGSLLPAVTLGNLLGGYAILALLAATIALAWRGHPDAAPARAFARRRVAAFAVVIGLALAAATLGGSIGAQYALAQCAAPTSWSSVPADALASLRVVAPFRTLDVVAGRIVPPAHSGGLCTLHGAAGGGVLLATLALALLVGRAHTAFALALAALALSAAAAGAAALATRPSLPLTVAHNACAALLLTAMAAGAARCVRDRRTRTPEPEPVT